ncbi:calmodulin-binding transcription activator 1-like isoform X5 [Daphnia pulicaria]|uniref:calmodulin-binding transcription activator 1-like isoform X5 n=1 Tax=Daphnia pulicaria TaxID=35523 RepID=UPI001EEC62AD|nr:calmodulin-binding transcription activator 1-like isoform X5 [Daphnia pulicaria]
MNLIQQQQQGSTSSTSSTGGEHQGAIENKMVESQPSCSRQSSQDDADSSCAVGVKQSPSVSDDGGMNPPINLPASLESLPRAEHFPTQRHRWNTNEEIAAVLINFERHPEWLFKEVKIRPKSGSMLLYSRKKVRYRRDGYCWKKRKDGKTTREDHMKLKVQGTECIYGCYVHSAILPTFHRRCYWLLQNPDIVLVHYLNVPYPDDAKLLVVASVSLWAERKEWSKDELISQLRPMFLSQDEPNLNNELEVSTAETVEAIVSQLMEKQRLARSGGTIGAVPVAVNGHVSNLPQRQPQPLQTGVGGRGSNNRSSNGAMEPQVQVQVHHNHKVGADASSHNDLAAGHSLPHSLRRLSNGGGGSSFIRLEPRPAPSHSNNIQQRQATPTDSAVGRAAPRAEATGFGLGRGGSPPTSQISSSSSLSSSSAPSFHTEQIHHHSEPVPCQQQQQQDHQQDHQLQQQQQQQQMISAKQESLDSNYYYSSNNCNNPGQQQQQQQQQQPTPHPPPTPAAPAVINSTPMNFMDHGSGGDQGNTFPSFYSLINANNASRRADEMLSGHGYRLPMDCLFNETLDLSQDDIQRTLSANLSHETAFHCSGGGGSGSNDGGASCSDGGLGRSIRSVETTAEDDLLVNLDAFDMLTEFSDLDCHDTIDSLISIQADGAGGGGGTSGSPSDGSDGKDLNGIHARIHQLKDMPSPSTLSATGDPLLTSITDFSPEWAPTEGGAKLLITGSFCSPTLSGSYSVLFDGIAVPAVWVQLGVLRCFCPPHSPGRVQLQVVRQGLSITQPAIFEYRQVSAASNTCQEGSSTAQWTNSLLSLLVGRLESLGTHLNVQGCGIEQLFSSLRAYLESGEVELQSAEEQLVSICRQLVTKRWRPGPHQQSAADDPSSNTNGTQQQQQQQQMNLLHLAAALGLLRVLCTLLNWRLENSSPALEREMSPLASDQQGYTPLMWACSQGHRDVVALLAQWDPSALNVHDRSGKSAWDVARQRGHHSLAEELETRRILSVRRSTVEPQQPLPLPPPQLAQLNKPSPSKPAESVAARQMLLAKRSSVDSVPNNNNNNNNNEPLGHNHQGYWRRPNAAKAHKLSRDDRSYSLPLGGAGQAYSSGRNSTGSNISGLAHDPSPSPHTMDSSNPSSLNGGSSSFDGGLDGLVGPCYSPCYSADIEGLESGDDGLLVDNSSTCSSSTQAAPCSSAAGGGVRSVGGGSGGVRRESVNSVDLHQQHLSPLTSIEQNTRVLTLAEQIIAAIPDRIKNETEEMVVGWSPCMELEISSVVSEVQSIEGSIDLAIVADAPPSLDGNDLTFEFSDQQYRYCETATPSSSLSPASSSCLQSPCSFSVNSPSPPPTTADFSEFLQYVYLKQMTKAAVVIQNQFRSYYEHKRFKKNMESPSTSSAANSASCNGGGVGISSSAAAVAAAYRNYRESSLSASSARQSREGTPTSSALKRTYSQRRQHQAARKIQQFMRQSKNNLLDVVVKSVAEREGATAGGRVSSSREASGSSTTTTQSSPGSGSSPSNSSSSVGSVGSSMTYHNLN